MVSNIHIVDADAPFRKAIGLLLRTHGYEATKHELADQLIGTISRANIGCLLLNVRVPGRTGLGTVSFLKQVVRRR